MNGSNRHTLNICLGGQVIGTLGYDAETEQFSLVYSATWQADGFALSPQLPLHGTISSTQIAIFLSNLLPENIGLDYLIDYLAVSKNNTFALIKAIGLDTAGAVTFISPNSELPTTHFRKILPTELQKRLETPDIFPLEIWDNKPRLSVAGVQAKLNVFMHQGEYGFGEGQLASTHIIKFEKKPEQHVVLNEYLSMRLAQHLGFSVAEVRMMPIHSHRALVVKRFDRYFDAANYRVLRRHIIDACQVLGFPVSKKYERNLGDGRDVKHIREGVSLPRLFSLAAYCTNPAQAKLNMLQWVLFNLCISNYDAHGKNYSFFVSKHGLSPTPWYDLVNISHYPQFSQNYAMAIGDEFTSDDIHAYQLAQFAQDCGINKRLLQTTLTTLCQSILQSLHTVISTCEHATHEEQQFTQAYASKVTSRCRHYLGQADAIPNIEA